MKLAFSRPTSSNEEMNVLFHHYLEVGYKGLQLKASQYMPYVQDPNLFLEKWGEKNGIASALIFGGDLRKNNLEKFKQVLKFANTVGTESIVFCHGLPRQHSSDSKLRDYAKELNDLGLEAKENYGVQLSLHHHYNQPVMYRKDFDIFFEQVTNNAVTLTVDTAHLYKSGIEDMAEIIYSFHDRIDNFHMKDFARGDWQVLGQGDINFDPIFQAIKEIGYDGWISADEESGGEIIDGMQACLEYMVKNLK
ncbi:TIM barrel protein [Gracilibacillus salitolerans]|uniref:TIM barrel protein n=1 Tax=Gracilibacillus salitolerans TaxID=2663022 RepID=A0A5Q2TMH6_9BACI|nr:sugar phosphate isomerase/epimerase [Gracilibacillus salitolerans]QGH35986.1 TIM barrel protein [Gracilibacillus salitolerans]